MNATYIWSISTTLDGYGSSAPDPLRSRPRGAHGARTTLLRRARAIASAAGTGD